jgi:hypothetical protein
MLPSTFVAAGAIALLAVVAAALPCADVAAFAYHFQVMNHHLSKFYSKRSTSNINLQESG